MPAEPETKPENLRASVWLIADMSLNIWALSIVKAMGADLPAAQIVFLRVLVGLMVLTPWIWRDRKRFVGLPHLPLHLLRVVLSSITLMASFFAIARVPLATFSAINFVRPVLLMAMAAVLLNERITKRRWLAVGLALGGAMIAIIPGNTAAQATAQVWGIASLCLSVISGTLAVILTRKLKGTPEAVMMLFYTGGIAVLVGPVAALSWKPVETTDWPILLLVGVFAQAAQICFLRAHWLGDAGVLASVSYLSIVISTVVGFFVFAEVPGWSLLLGAGSILIANLVIFQGGRRNQPPRGY